MSGTPTQSPFDLHTQIFWPTYLFFRVWNEHPQHAPALVEYLYQLKSGAAENIASQVAQSAKSGQGLFESDFDLFRRDHPALNRLKLFIGKSVQEAVAKVQNGKVAAKQIRVEVTDSWFHITNDGGFHDAHYHSNCSWCGIFYVRSGDSSSGPQNQAGNGVNRFYSPLPTGGMAADLGSEYLESNRIDIAPRDGLLVLFPAYLLHSALAYRGQSDRVVIAFNTRSVLAN